MSGKPCGTDDKQAINGRSQLRKSPGDEISYSSLSRGVGGVGGSDSDDLLRRRGPPHRSLTVPRLIRGVACLLVLLSTALIMLIFLAPICCVLVRIFSRHRSRELVAFIFGHWLAMWPFLFEEINRTRVVFSGDRVAAGERVIAICNHRTEVDWMYLWNLALRKGRIGYVKYVVKNSVRNVPVFGWALYVMEFLLIERKWEVDEPIMAEYLTSFQNPRDPLWLILFPEGTDFTERKKVASQEFAEKKGLPRLEHVLIPRTRGFLACLSHLRGSLDAVYDLTIAYKNRCPLFVDNLFGIDPAEVHIHIRRVAVDDIPASEEDCLVWLYETYQRKDELLASFVDKGSFSSSSDSIEQRLSWCEFAMNFSGVVACTLVLWFLTFFSSLWIRLYFGLSCVYFAAASYVGWRI